MVIHQIPPDALILPIGPSGSGKSTTMAKWFGPQALVSSDYCRQLVCGDMTCQDYNREAFEIFHQIIRTRMRLGVLTVADATNLRADSRKALYAIADEYKREVWNIFLYSSLDQMRVNNVSRSRRVPDDVLVKHHHQFTTLFGNGARAERKSVVTHFPYTDVDFQVIPRVEVQQAPGWWVISDVHACDKELSELLTLIPREDKIVFVGDFVDRGPYPKEVLNTVYELVANNMALAVPGNHDWKLYRAVVRKSGVRVTAELQDTLDKVTEEDVEFIGNLPLQVHVTVPGSDKVVTVVHGALKHSDRGVKGVKAVDAMCLYGETDGTKTPDGYPTRTWEWAKTWTGNDICVVGHTPVKEITWYGENVVNIDTGCAFGGCLTAYNPFTKQSISVPARQTYKERV